MCCIFRSWLAQISYPIFVLALSIMIWWCVLTHIMLMTTYKSASILYQIKCFSHHFSTEYFGTLLQGSLLHLNIAYGTMRAPLLVTNRNFGKYYLRGEQTFNHFPSPHLLILCNNSHLRPFSLFFPVTFISIRETYASYDEKLCSVQYESYFSGWYIGSIKLKAKRELNCTLPLKI